MITLEQAKKVYSIIDAGLVSGLGRPKPGELCVEAAICLALDEPHGDRPPCVGAPDQTLSVRLNDQEWSSPAARAKGLKRLAIAQLGSKALSVAQRIEWTNHIVGETIGVIVPMALRAAASMPGNKDFADNLEKAAKRCEAEKSEESAANAAYYAAAYAAYFAAANAAYYAAANAAYYAAAYAAYFAAANAANYAAAYAAANAANAAAYAAYAARDEVLTKMASIVVDAYRKVQAPGIALLDALEVKS